MHYKTKEMLRNTLLEQLEALDGNSGNIRLKKAVEEYLDREISQEDYDLVRDELVDEEIIGRGQGRGGSVYLLDWEEKEEDEATEKAKPAKQEKKAGMSSAPGGDPYGTYEYDTEATSRPDVGVQEQFNVRKPPKQYRYDSSLAPVLCWDENAEREFAEWLLNLVAEAAEKGEGKAFAEEQVWKGNGERFSSISQCVARLKSLTQPFLNWAGKAERQQISAPTVPLFVHERHSTQNILKTLESHRAAGTTLDLFGDQANKDIADNLDAYTHKEQWANRLILGDSLQVMNSLLEYEGMGGQAQMVYFDPPYGVKFGSNFQPFVRKREVKHGKDEEMIREPEMVKAYRDTWELGLHSYLGYLRDRLLMARNLLAQSGSIFIQISDDNLHYAREIASEIFGEENFCGLIAFRTTGGQSTSLLSTSTDFLVWYAKDKKHAKAKFNNPAFSKYPESGAEGQYVWVLGSRLTANLLLRLCIQ